MSPEKSASDASAYDASAYLALGRSVTVTSDRGALLATVLFFLLACELLLFLLDLTVNWRQGSDTGAIRRLFNTAREDSLAGWFAVTQTFVVALLAWTLVIIQRSSGAGGWRRWGWLIIALLFTYMAMDDGAKIHERLGTWSKSFTATSSAVDAYPSYAWQLILGPFFAAMGLFLLVFLWIELTEPMHRLGIIAALACLTLAVGLDVLEGLEGGYGWLAQSSGLRLKMLEHFSRSLEECLEMLGMSLFLIVFLAHLSRCYPHITLRFRD